jgi:hypothetical protein
MKSTFLALFAPALAGCVCGGGVYIGARRRHLVPVDIKEVQMMTLAEEGPIFGAKPLARPLARPRSPARRRPPPLRPPAGALAGSPGAASGGGGGAAWARLGSGSRAPAVAGGRRRGSRRQGEKPVGAGAGEAGRPSGQPAPHQLRSCGGVASAPWAQRARPEAPRLDAGPGRLRAPAEGRPGRCGGRPGRSGGLQTAGAATAEPRAAPAANFLIE